jgi:hypothetical protein
MINPEQIIIRPATKDDAIPVTRLLRDTGIIVPSDDEAVEEWNRLWMNNPSYRDFPSLPDYGWVMEYVNQIIGYLGHFQRTYYLNGTPLPVYITTLWGVSKEYRKYTLLLSEKYFNNTKANLVLSTTAQEASGLIFERFGGGQRIPVDNLNEIFTIPFSANNYWKNIFSLSP